MTLDFKKLIRNAVKKQMTIQHYSCNVQIFKREELPAGVMSRIQSIEGVNAPLAGDYFLWFSGKDITNDVIKNTIFKIANAALGEAANNLREGDIRMIDLVGGATEPERPKETSDEVDSMVDPASDADNDAASGDLIGSADVSESVESPVSGEKFCYLMITMK